MTLKNSTDLLIHGLKRGVGWLLQSLLVIAILLAGAWVSMALWFQLPASRWLIITVIIGWWGLSSALLIGWFARRIHKTVAYGSAGCYMLCWIVLLCWWQTIQPQQNKHWAADVDRQVQVEQTGHLVTLHNVRNFDWRSETDFTPHWETRQYDLRKLSSLDVITSYWMGPKIAHVLLSFGFDDGQYLTFSIETRRENNEVFSTFGGFFRKFELSLIAADERDIIYTRTNIRKEQVYLYRMQVSKATIRSLFNNYLQEARELDRQPRFYNTLTSNCTTIVFDMARLIDPGLPLDYRIVLSGYLPQYIYEQHGLDQHVPFRMLQQQAYINPLALQYAQSAHQQFSAAGSSAFSRAIRRNLAAQPLDR
ncbi:MAG: DUF4105 domain-containing protein [Moraxellaceae bacterium]|nr:MAG: DUF4105 domain-containing protein [Moraxellaceae bacterium]